MKPSLKIIQQTEGNNIKPGELAAMCLTKWVSSIEAFVISLKWYEEIRRRSYIRC